MSESMEKINWKESNLAVFGSDLEKKIKAAASGDDKAWKSVGSEEQLSVWRIEKFCVKAWPQKKYGKFYKGDSYIILNTYSPGPFSPSLCHDLHIWIGQDTTEDEYGTAAYKMVELDERLGGTAVQYREMQGSESIKFQEYFGGKLTYWKGGIESGYGRVEPSDAEPQLFQIKGTKKSKNLRMIQVPVRRDSLNSGDVFVLVAGEDHVWLWVGEHANKDEKTKAVEVARDFTKGNVIVLEQGLTDSEKAHPTFWSYMPSRVSMMGPLKRSLNVQGPDDDDEKGKAFVPVLFRLLQDRKGRMGGIKQVATATHVGSTGNTQYQVPQSFLRHNYALLLDTGFQVYIWIGSKVSTEGRMMVVPQSQEYFKAYKRPIRPVTILKEGQETATFKKYFHETAASSSCQCLIL